MNYRAGAENFNSRCRYDWSTPEEGEVCPGHRIVEPDDAGNRSSPVIPFSSRSSSLEDEGDETEDDPDWCAEDPDDPEWTGRDDSAGAAAAAGAAATQGKRRASTASSYQAK